MIRTSEELAGALVLALRLDDELHVTEEPRRLPYMVPETTVLVVETVERRRYKVVVTDVTKEGI